MSLIKTKDGWTTREGVDKWSEELKKLIEEAKTAAANDASGPRLEVAAYLAGFIQESFPQTPEMDQLDETARKLAVDIMERTIDERLAAIAARTTEYVTLQKEIEGAAARGEHAADSIRLKGITNLIETSTQVITSAKAVAASLDDATASDKKVAGLIAETVEAVEKLRSAVAKLI